jgi:hypothetical protein
MPAAADPIRQFADKVVRQAKADPRKASVLAVLVAVMGVMWYRVITGGGGPASASAYAAGANASASAFAPSPADVYRPTGRLSAAAAALQEWARTRPVVALSRNLFVTNYDLFPLDGGRTTPTTPTTPTVYIERGDGFWDRLAKSLADRADQIKEHRARVETIRSEAAKLKVQSTLMGASPKALVNGRLVGLGDVVASFRVTKIEARRIVVEREGIKFALRFN